MQRRLDLKHWHRGRHVHAGPLPLERASSKSERRMTRALLELASSSHGDWDASIRQVVQFDAEMLHVERVSFWSFGDDKASIRCDTGYVASTRSFEHGATLLARDQRAYFAAIRDERLLSIEDVSADPRTSDLRDYSSLRGIASVLDVPVWVDGRLAGVLCHEHVGARRRWRPAEEDFAMGAGQVVAATLVARAQTVAESAARRAAFLDNVSRLILPSLDTQKIAARVVGQVVPRFADQAVIWAIHVEGGLDLLASTHADPGMRDLVAQVAYAAATNQGRAGLRYVVTQGQSLLYPDISPAVLERLDPIQRDRAVQLGVRTYLAVPLTVPGATIGVMAWLGSSTRHLYDSQDLALAEAVAERIAAGLENARLYEMARQAIRARDEFLVLAAHELRTPLTALQLFAHDMQPVASRGAAADAARGAALDRQVRRLGALIERLCDAARLRAEGMVLALDSCDLAGIVKERASAATERRRRGGSPIAVRADTPVVGRWDRTRMAQLVDELVDNAIKFGQGKPIEVALESDGKDAALMVRDHGVGIAPDHLASVFAPFERAVPKEHFGGLGLGLHVAKSIVEAHGGTIEASSQPGQGTTMIASLPIIPPIPAARDVRSFADRPPR
jgi:signal transduction histidine kinase